VARERALEDKRRKEEEQRTRDRWRTDLRCCLVPRLIWRI
jgi:hypothetical protein